MDPPGERTEGQENKNKNRNQSLRNEEAARERRAHEADGKRAAWNEDSSKKGHHRNHVSRVLRRKRSRMFNTLE